MRQQMVIAESCRGKSQRVIKERPITFHLASFIVFGRQQLQIRRTMGVKIIHHLPRSGKLVGTAIEQRKNGCPAMPERHKTGEDQGMPLFQVINSIMLAKKAS